MDRPGPPLWLEQLSYFLIALLAVLPALLTPGHIIGDGVDMYGTFWFYWWIQECLLNWQDPSYTKLFFFPLGKDIFAHTGNNFLDALVAQPFQWVLGYPRYQPVYVGFLLWTNALAFRPLAGAVLGRRTWAAWGATMLWMLSPYTLFEFMTGRLTQAFLWFVPLALYHFIRIKDRRWRDPLLCGLFTGLAGWTYWFNGFFLAFAMAWLAVAALIRREDTPWRLLLGWVAAGATCLLSILPAARRMSKLAAEGQVPGLSRGGTDILSGPDGVANNVSDALHGYILMETEGHTMFLSLVWGGGLLLYVLLGRDRLRWLGLVVVTMAFALGPQLPTDPPLVMPHYMLAYHYLPFFDRLWFPYRMVGVTFVGVSLGLGLLIQRLSAWRWVWTLPVGLVLLTMAEQSREYAFPLLHRDLTPPKVYQEIGRVGGALLEAPLGLSRISIAHQPVHGQPVFGGMGENASVLWPPGFQRRQANGFVQFLRSLSRDPREPVSYREGHLTNFKAEGFRWVVLDRQLMDAEIRRRWQGKAEYPALDEEGAFLAQDAITAHLGPPWAVDGPLVVWDLKGGLPSPAGLAPTPENLTQRTWPWEDGPEYEREAARAGRAEDP